LRRLVRVALLLSVFLAGCAGEMEFRDGKQMLAEGRTEEGLAQIQKAIKEAPESQEYRNYYYRQREQFLNQTLQQGDTARRKGRLEAAEEAYRRVLATDSGNERAQAGIEMLQLERRHQERLKVAEKFIKEGKSGDAEEILNEILTENPGQKEARLLKRKVAEDAQKKARDKPSLKSSLQKPVSLEFRDASVRAVFELLSRTAGINFVFDRDVKPDLKTTLFVKDSTVEDVIRLALVTNQLEQKILNENSILIYPNTPAKLKEYQELMVKSFYLTNADAKQVMNTLKTLLKVKDVSIDEKLNYLVVRDTPEVVALAEKLVANEDKPEPEVILDLEVLEVGTNHLTDLGIRYPEQVSASFVGTAGKSGTFGLNEWKNRDSRLVQMHVTDPAFILNLKKVDTDTNLLANPRIRVRNREKAKVHIGEKVPVITTTSTANVGVSESVTYLDIGLKLDVEPNIYLDDDVAIKVGLEVSNILETVTRASGLQTYRLGTRNATTTLQLKDGETQILAGLIQNDERNTANKVPGLGDVPILGRLFSSHNDSNIKTEIVLLITPHVVRNIIRPDAKDSEFLSGTEASTGAPPIRLNQVDEQPLQVPSQGSASAASAPAVTVSVEPKKEDGAQSNAAPVTQPQAGAPPKPLETAPAVEGKTGN
jgi:general secretion pathway protein D